MIRAMIFDLDGTLAQTERIKALSYHRAVAQLGLDVSEAEVVELYKEVVGQTRHVVSRHIMERLGLEAACVPLMAQYAAREPAEVLTALRLALYEAFISDDAVLRENRWPYTVDLVRTARQSGCRIALATSSLTAEARRVLKALDLEQEFDAVVGLDQVVRGKPDPEIYLTAAARLGVPPADCLVIEDSPPGVAAALAAGMNVIGVATPFTLLGLHAPDLIDHQWIVHEPERLLETVNRRIEQHKHTVDT